MPTIPSILHGLDPAVRELLVRSLPGAQLRAVARSLGEWAHVGGLPPLYTSSGEN